MKRILLTLLIILILLGGAAVILPSIYKDDIMKIVKNEINKNVDAKVNFQDVHLSLIRSFPHFSLGIDELSLAGKGDFESDTLLYVERMNTTLNLMSVLNSEPIQVIGVDIHQPDIHIKVLKSGKANYDIVKTSDKQPSESRDTTSASEEMKIVLQKVTISEGNLIYDDATIPYRMEINGIEHKLRGDLTQSRTMLNTRTEAENSRVVYDGVQYLSNVKMDLDADLEVDFDKMKFTFTDNLLKINEIGLEAEGWFRMLEEGYDMDIAFETRRNRFKPFLSLIPAIYQKDFETVDASGNFEMLGFVRGKYSEEEMPAYHTEIKVSGGAFSYPTLPDKIEDINFNLTVDNNTGLTDDVVVNASRFEFAVAGNPF
ncbi:MAG: AsmA family protein, partial [Bacteroidales bacterium]|nr:AsmA family protein [Bacteroidales bacterium]